MAGDGSQWIPEKRIAGVSARCSNARPEEISALWERFARENVGPRTAGTGLYAVYFEYAGDFNEPYTLLIGAEIDDDAPLPEGMQEVLIEPGEYVVFDVTAPLPQGIADGWQRVWASGLSRAYRTDFEMYHEAGHAAIYVGSWEA